MDVRALMAEIGSRLQTLDGLHVFAYPADQVTPPCAVVELPEELLYDETYGRGMDRLTLRVWVAVNRSDVQNATLALAGYMSHGPGTVKHALETGAWSSCDEVRVARAESAEFTVAGVQFMATEYELDVAGQGK